MDSVYINGLPMEDYYWEHWYQPAYNWVTGLWDDVCDTCGDVHGGIDDYEAL